MFIIRNKIKKSCFSAKNVAKKQDFLHSHLKQGSLAPVLCFQLFPAALRMAAYCIFDRLSKRVYAFWKNSFTVSTGPLRCFATMTSVMFLLAVSGS